MSGDPEIKEYVTSFGYELICALTSPEPWGEHILARRTFEIIAEVRDSLEVAFADDHVICTDGLARSLPCLIRERLGAGPKHTAIAATQVEKEISQVLGL